MAPGEDAAASARHDFPQPAVPRAYPYGIYDIGRDPGFVNVGTDHDTGAFAVASIRGWWRQEAKGLYPNAQRLLITADAGASNGWRQRLRKVELKKFADPSGLTVSLGHFPPATSQWGEPLRDYETIVNLIAETTTKKGLTVTCRLGPRKYPTGRNVTAEEMAQVNIYPDKFHGK